MSSPYDFIGTSVATFMQYLHFSWMYVLWRFYC